MPELRMTVERSSALVLVLIVILGFSAEAFGTPAVDLFRSAGIQLEKGQTLAPRFNLPTVEGPAVDSAALQGKVVLVNFWATWCGPCKEEMPAMQRLQQSLPSNDFALVAITTDQQRKAIAAFAESLMLSFPILLDETNDVSAAFGVRGLPTTVIVDREGKMVGRAVGPRRWDSPESLALLKDLLQ